MSENMYEKEEVSYNFRTDVARIGCDIYLVYKLVVYTVIALFRKLTKTNIIF